MNLRTAGSSTARSADTLDRRRRLYRGERHPTGLLASILFAGLWLTAASVLIKPNSARKQ